jgi:hypothetical protein
MARVPYDPEHIARFFDEYGTREWERFDATPMDRVGLEVHLRLLREHIRDGDRVLDAGVGPVASHSNSPVLARPSLPATSRRVSSTSMPG